MFVKIFIHDFAKKDFLKIFCRKQILKKGVYMSSTHFSLNVNKDDFFQIFSNKNLQKYSENKSTAFVQEYLSKNFLLRFCI